MHIAGEQTGVPTVRGWYLVTMRVAVEGGQGCSGRKSSCMFGDHEGVVGRGVTVHAVRV